jgi:methyl-accepting chemotaxis protein
MPAGTASQIVDGISPIDGKRRIVSMHALVHYPVTIAVSIDRAAVLARWWTEAALFAGAAALLDLAIAASVMLMLRHMQFQAVEAESARQDAAAEAQRDRDSAAMDIQAATDRAAILAGLATAFEHQVGQMSRAVAASAAQLQTSAITLTSLAADASEQTRSAAADAAVGAADVNRIAGATALLNQSIETVARQAGDGAAVISAAAAAVHDADATMAMLTSSAGRIGEVVNMIGDFARRTNLLALNATIEAARAGDAGRGFAVVAAEVKTLSKAVSTATDEIRRQIDGMQEATTQTAGAMQQIRSVVSMIDTITSDVTHTMEEHRRATEQIAGAISDTATGAQVLSEIINGASHAATETGATAADVQLTARILADGADGLRNASDDFLVQVQTR